VPPPFDAPWYAPYSPWLARLAVPALAGRWSDCRDELNRLATAQGLVNARGLPLRFADRLPDDGLAYEARIDATGLVHTRTDDSAWHDLFNAVVWLAFPRTKARLNGLQARAIARDGVGARRGPLRDAATLFDENAALVVLREPALRAAWRAHDWQAVFGPGGASPAWEADPVIFGHALLDKLRAPYKAACAHAWLLDAAPVVRGPRGQIPTAPDRDGPERPDAGFVASLDATVAAALDASLARDPFVPLPVLGVPGWCPANADPAFYDDPAVFRPPPRRRVGSACARPAPDRPVSDGDSER
jgi:hypothetical protein